MFPLEIWEIILSKINDAEELINLRLVCHDWKDIIDNFFKHSQYDIWQSLCTNRIPNESICSVIKVSYNSTKYYNKNYRKLSNDDYWKSIYKSWLKWKKIMKIQARKTSVEVGDLEMEDITCTSMWNDILAVGTNEGYIYFYNIFNLVEPFYVDDHKEYIIEITFWNPGKEIIAISTSVCKHIKFWDVKRQRKLTSPLSYTGQFLCCTPQSFYHITPDIINETIVESERIANHIITKGNKTFHLNGDEKVVGMFVELNELIILSRKDDMISLSILETTLTSDERFFSGEFKKMSSCLPSKFAESEIKEFVFLSNIILAGLSNNLLAIFVDGKGWFEYNTLEYLQGVVTAIILHADLLILGLDSGVVYVFDLDSIDQLADFSFDRRKSRKLMVDKEEIVSLNVTECSSEPYIIAATKRKIHLIQFY